MFGDEFIAIPDLENNVRKGRYSMSRKVDLSLQGLEFMNRCLDFNENARLSWDELESQPYLNMDEADYLDINKLDAVSNGSASYEDKMFLTPDSSDQSSGNDRQDSTGSDT